MRCLVFWLTSLAGCQPPTSIDTRVIFDDNAHKPEDLVVSLLAGSVSLVVDRTVIAPGGRAVRSGDDFVTLLPDSVSGEEVTISVDTVENGHRTLHGESQTTAIRHGEVTLDLPLGADADGGADAGPGGPDAGGADAASGGADASTDGGTCGGDGEPCCPGNQCPTSTKGMCKNGVCR